MEAEPGAVGGAARRKHPLAIAHDGHRGTGAGTAVDRERRATRTTGSRGAERPAGERSPEAADHDAAGDKASQRRCPADSTDDFPKPPRGDRADHDRSPIGASLPANSIVAREARKAQHTDATGWFIE